MTSVTLYTFSQIRCRGCTTPQQLGNLKTTIEGNLDYLDGYEELPPDLQAVVARAVENGHVDDADWKGVSDLHSLRACNDSYIIRIWIRIDLARKASDLQLQRRMRERRKR